MEKRLFHGGLGAKTSLTVSNSGYIWYIMPNYVSLKLYDTFFTNFFNFFRNFTAFFAEFFLPDFLDFGSLHLNDSLSQIIHNLKLHFFLGFGVFFRFFRDFFELGLLLLRFWALYYTFWGYFSLFITIFSKFTSYVCDKKIIYVLS